MPARIHRIAAVPSKPEDKVVNTETQEAIEEIVTSAIKVAIAKEVDMPNFLACISVSFLSSLCINEGLDKKEIKALIRKIRDEVLSSAKQFYDGNITEWSRLEEPHESGQSQQGE